jgi:hypothetical protein
MIFHMVGIACIAASLNGIGIGHQPKCHDWEDTSKDYSTLKECVTAADKSKIQIPENYDTWIRLDCIQMPEGK